MATDGNAPFGRRSSLLLAILFTLAPGLRAEERAVVSLKELVSTEVRSQGFTLPAP